MINIPKYRSIQGFSKTNIYEIIKNQEIKSKPILKKLISADVDSKTTSLIFFEREDTNEIYLYQGLIAVGAVLDDKFNEELDTMTINLVHSKNDDFLSYLIPNNTKVLYIPQVKISDVIVTLENGEQYVDTNKLFTFDNDGKPINHKQYIICGGSINYGKTVIKHQYGLVEPTAILRLGDTGTNSHTNMPKAIVYDTNGNTTTYEQAETNLYSIIERQFKITGLKNSKEDRSWFKHFNIYGLDVDAGRGMSESFNNATLYDSMFKIGKYIKSYPVIYFNKDYVFNPGLNADLDANKEFNLFFESYEIRNQKRIDLNDIKCLEASWSIVNSTGRFTNHVACEAENIIPTQEIVYPNEKEYVGLTGDLNEISFTEPKAGEAIPYYLRTGKKIQHVDSVTMIIINGNKEWGGYNTDRPLRTSYNAIEYSDWLLLSKESRGKTVYYTIGDDKIYVGHLDEIKNNHSGMDVNIYIGKIKYKPLISAKIESNYGDYTDIFNQTDSNLDGNLFGNYMQEYATSQTNFDVLFQASFENYDDIPETGTIISNNENDFIIISRKILVNKTSFYVSFALNYYEPKRSELINASKKITKTFVDSSKAFERLVNFKETYLVDVTTDEDDIVNQEPKYFKDYKSIVPFYNDDEFKQNSIAVSFNFSKENTNKHFNKLFKVSASSSVTGTSIIINFTTQTSKVFGVFGGFIQLNGEHNYNKNQVTDYTDVFGKVRSIDLVFSKLKDYDNEKSIDDSFDEMIGIYNRYDNLENVPSIPSDKYWLIKNWGDEIKNVLNSYYSISSNEFDTLKESSVFELNGLEILKDTNEILNFTYQIEFLPRRKNKVMLFNNFAKFSNFINREETDFINNLFITEINSNINIDSTTETISIYNLNTLYKVTIQEKIECNNAFIMNISNLKLDKAKQYILIGRYNSKYYPLILLTNINSSYTFNDAFGLEQSSLILYLTNANI